MPTILSEEQLRAIRAKHGICGEDKTHSISDHELMTEFLESVTFVGEVRDWRELPELGERDDDEDAPDEDESDD